MMWLVIALSQYNTPAMVAKVTKAVPTDELIVVVHQRPELIEPTVSHLDQPHYANSPRVMLTDGASSPLTPLLMDRATVARYSKLGELSLNVDAKTVTLIGGSANDCLRRSGQLLIKEMLDRRKRKSLSIRLPSEVIWGWIQKEGGFTLKDSFCKGSPAKFDARVKEFAETFIKDMNFPDPFSITQIYKIEPGRAGEMDYHFVFTRKSDGKKVNLILEQLCD
jgi:hypothetical protein